MQIDIICRVCLREDDKTTVMSEKIHQKLLLFANLTAEEIPDVPANLCASCEQKLNISFDFKEQCQKSHKILSNYVKKFREVDSEAAEKPSQVEQFSQCQVSEAIKDSKQSFYKNTNCIRCSYVGSNLRGLSVHMSRVHKDLRPRWCGACNREFDNLTDHIATNHSDDYTCKFCGKKFLRLGNLNQHLRNHSDVKLFPCTFCEKGFKRQSCLNVHLKKHSEPKQYKCGSCDESFTRLHLLKDHSKTHQSEDDEDKHLAAFKLEEHKRVHTSKAPHKCTYCDKKFNTHHRLVIHKRIHTGERPHICQVCGKSFNQTSHLKIHMMVHKIGPKKNCKICNKEFYSTHRLRRHLKRHTGDKPFVCTDCGKAFMENGDLVQHNKKHSDLRPFQCSNCDKAFKHSNTFKRHMWIHSGEKPYKCTQCSYASRYSGNLSKHMKRHVVDKPRADRPHLCLMCNSTFTTDAMLTFHVNTHSVSFLEI